MSSAEPHVGVLVHDQFQELEFWYPVLRLREEGIAVTVLGAEGERTYVSQLGYPVIPDKTVAEVAAGDFDAILLPGGGAADCIAADRELMGFVAAAVAGGLVIGAISEAPKVLSAANLLRGRRVAGAPSIAAAVGAAGGEWSDDAIVVDGRMITARSADELTAFFKALAKTLAAEST